MKKILFLTITLFAFNLYAIDFVAAGNASWAPNALAFGGEADVVLAVDNLFLFTGVESEWNEFTLWNAMLRVGGGYNFTLDNLVLGLDAAILFGAGSSKYMELENGFMFNCGLDFEIFTRLFPKSFLQPFISLGLRSLNEGISHEAAYDLVSPRFKAGVYIKN